MRSLSSSSGGTSTLGRLMGTLPEEGTPSSSTSGTERGMSEEKMLGRTEEPVLESEVRVEMRISRCCRAVPS